MMERRKCIRIEVEVLVNFNMDFIGKTKNISENGFCMITNTLYKKDNLLTCLFTLPGLNEMKVIGTVTWVRENTTNKYDTGIEFWHIEEEDREKIREFIKKRFKAEIMDICLTT